MDFRDLDEEGREQAKPAIQTYLDYLVAQQTSLGLLQDYLVAPSAYNWERYENYGNAELAAAEKTFKEAWGAFVAWGVKRSVTIKLQDFRSALADFGEDVSEGASTTHHAVVDAVRSLRNRLGVRVARTATK